LVLLVLSLLCLLLVVLASTISGVENLDTGRSVIACTLDRNASVDFKGSNEGIIYYLSLWAKVRILSCVISRIFSIISSVNNGAHDAYISQSMQSDHILTAD